MKPYALSGVSLSEGMGQLCPRSTFSQETFNQGSFKHSMGIQMKSSVDALSDTANFVPIQLIRLLHRAGQCGDDLFLKGIQTATLTPRQFTILKAAQNRHEASQALLVQDTGVDRSTLADIVSRLVAKGLLERSRTSQDARTYAIRVTENGARTISELTPRIAEIENTILAPLSASERSNFLTSLDLIVNNLQHLHGADNKTG